MKEEKYCCSTHGNIDYPVIVVNIEFVDENIEDWNEITDLEYVDEIESYVKETKEALFPNEKIKDYGYGLCCPDCLEYVD